MTGPLRLRPRTAAAQTLAVCLALGASLARGQEGPAPAGKEFKVDRVEWLSDPTLAQAVRSVVVRNDYGDIRARLAGDGLVMVSAVIQRLGTAPDIGVNVERHGDALVVSVVSPPGRRAVGSERPGKTEVDRADLVVYVPEGASLQASSLRGMVEARRLKRAVDVQTMDGEIRAESEGPVRARSRSGDVTVWIGGGADGPSLVETASGNVWLSLQEGAPQQLQVETSGKVTSAVPLKDESGPATSPSGRRRMVQDGPAGVPVVVRSDSGAVEVSQRRK